MDNYEQNVIRTEGDKTYIRLSDTAIKMWESCHAKFYFRRICGLVPRDRIHVFDIGTLGHVGCKVFLHPSNAQHNIEDRYKLARAAINEHFNTILKPAGATQDSLDEALHTFPVIMRRQLATTTIGVEQWWEATITDPAFPNIVVQFVGKADATSLLENALYVEEHKFVSARGFGDRKVDEYQKARQTKGYVFLANENLKTTKPIRGVIHNFFLKMKNPELRQEITYVGPKDIERFKQSMMGVANEINTAYQTDNWRESLDECRGWSGTCPFARLCEFDDNDEVRAALFDIHKSEDKFEILNAK